MRLKNYIFGLMALLAMATSIQQPLFAEKKHSSSSSSCKEDKCCKQSKKLLKQINQTTMQDLVVDQTTLNVVNQINQTTQTDLAVDQETLEIVKHLEDCSCTCTVILPQDFEDEEGNLTQTYFITEPGSYCLGADVAFAPADEFTPAINILANDVRLDLRGFTLSQGNDTPNAYGVQIGEGYFYNDPDAVLKNITVFNGNITNFTAIGVFCFNASSGQLSFESLRFSNLNVLDCGSSPSFDFASGINLDSDSPSPFLPEIFFTYENIIIENCNVDRCLGNGSIQVFVGNNVVINNTQANDLTNTEVIFYTFAHTYQGGIHQVFNCRGNNVKELDPNATFSQAGGILISTTSGYIKDCQFNDAFGEASTIVNSNPSLCQNFIAENCQFNNARGGELARLIAGAHMSDGPFEETQGNGIKFINCQFNGATVSPTNTRISHGTLTCGFLAVTLRNIEFEGCQACNISSDNPNFSSFGYYLGTDNSDPIPLFSNGRNFTFSNCTVSDISTSGRKAIGFFLTASTGNRIGEQGQLTNMVLKNCIAERIQSATSTEIVAGIAEGLDVKPTIGTAPQQFNLFIRDCRVSDVRSNIDDPSPLSAGIVAQSVRRPDICNNSVSDCDRGILLTGTDEITPNNLFQLAATLDDALAFPPVFIDLNTIPASAPLQDFDNITQGNSISIAPSSSTISTSTDFIFAPVDLNTLGWQPGDQIFYDCNGGNPISNLVCGTTYYAIVYIPGFSENGLIQNNKVDNCSISCYQDDLSTTASAWVDNTAFNCGVMPTQFTNYDIDFAGVRPVDAGTLTAYPVGGNKYYNLSLVP